MFPRKQYRRNLVLDSFWFLQNFSNLALFHFRPGVQFTTVGSIPAI